MLLAFVVAFIEVVILALVSDGTGRLVAFVSEIGFLLFFPPLMEKEFKEWKAAHPDVEPSGGWNAIGLGLIGALIFLAMGFVAALILAWLFPDRS